MAVAKHRPMMRRFRSNQRLKDPGKTINSEEAANAKYNQGTASRTEKVIIALTAATFAMSSVDTFRNTAAHIGTTTSANRFQLFSNLLFRMDELDFCMGNLCG